LNGLFALGRPQRVWERRESDFFAVTYIEVPPVRDRNQQTFAPERPNLGIGAGCLTHTAFVTSVGAEFSRPPIRYERGATPSAKANSEVGLSVGVS